MNAYYLTTSSQYIEVSYAPSGRAKCKKCKSTIDKESLRIGQSMDNDHFNAKNWYHVDCFKLKPRFQSIDPETQIYNLNELSKKDQKEILKCIKNEVKRFSTGKSKETKKPSKSRGKKIEEPSRKENTKSRPKSKAKEEKSSFVPTRSTRLHPDLSWIDGDEKKSRRSTSKSVQQSNKKEEVKKDKTRKSEPKFEKKSEQKPQSRRSKSKKSVSKSRKSESKRQKQEIIPKKKKQKKKMKAFVGYTEGQQKQFKELTNEYMKKTAEQLKKELELNLQIKGGNKIDLAERCADGKVLGQIPTCASCGGGKLRFNAKTGIYKCPGYMDDVDFVHCNKSFSMEEVKRNPWVEP